MNRLCVRAHACVCTNGFIMCVSVCLSVCLSTCMCVHKCFCCVCVFLTPFFYLFQNTVISLESLRKNLEPKRASAGPTSSAISPVKDDRPASAGLPNTRNGHPPDTDLPRGRGNHPNSGRSGQQRDRLHHPAARDPPARDNDKSRKDFRDNRKDFRDNRHDFRDGRNDQYKGRGFRNREDRTRAGNREGRNEKPRDYQGGHRTASSRDSDSQPHNTEKRDRENGPRAGDGEWRNEKSRDYQGGHRNASSRDSDSQPHNTEKRDGENGPRAGDGEWRNEKPRDYQGGRRNASSRDSDSQPHNTEKRERENGPRAGDGEWRNEKSRDYQGGRRNASSRDGDTAENRHRNNDPEKRTQTSRDYPRDPRNNQNRDKGGRSRDNRPRESNQETRTGALRGLGDAQHHGSRATDEDRNSEGGNRIPQKGEADKELSRAGNRSGHNGRRADRDRRPRSDLPQNQPEKAGFHVRDEDCDRDQRIKNGASQPNRSGEDASSFGKMSPGYHETGELHGKMPKPAEQLSNSDKASPHNRTDEEAQREGAVLSHKAHTAPRKSAEQRGGHPQASDQPTERLAQDCRDDRHSESGGPGRKGKKDGRYRRGAGRSRGIELSVSGHPSPQGTEASTDFKAQRESWPHSARSRDKKEVLSNGTAEGGGGEFAGPETLLTNDHHGHKGHGRFYRRGDKVSGQHDKMPGEKQHQRDNKPAAESAPDTQRSSPADQVEHSEGIPPRPAVPCIAGCPPGFLVSGPPPGFSVTDSSVKPLPTLNATAKVRPPPGFEFT